MIINLSLYIMQIASALILWAVLFNMYMLSLFPIIYINYISNLHYADDTQHNPYIILSGAVKNSLKMIFIENCIGSNVLWVPWKPSFRVSNSWYCYKWPKITIFWHSTSTVWHFDHVMTPTSGSRLLSQSPHSSNTRESFNGLRDSEEQQPC